MIPDVARIHRSGIFRLRQWVVMLTLLLGVGIPANAEVVTVKLRNGDRLTGEVIQQGTNSVTLSNAWSAQIVIPLAEIESPEFQPPAPPPAVPAATNVVQSAPPAPAKPAEEAAPPPAQPTPAAASKPEPKPEPKTEPEKRWTDNWKGEVEIGLDVLRGERDREIYSGRAKLTYVKNRFRNILDYSYAYGETDGVVNTDRMWGSSKTDFDVGPERRVYVYNQGTAGFDIVRKIDLRYSVGPGVGYHVIKKPKFVLDVEAGLNYQVEERATGVRNKDFNFRVAESFTWKINSRTTLEEDFEFIPEAENPDSFRLRFETSLSYLLVKNLFLKASIIDTYETDPSNNVQRNELQIRSSLNYKF